MIVMYDGGVGFFCVVELLFVVFYGIDIGNFLECYFILSFYY